MVKYFSWYNDKCFTLLSLWRTYQWILPDLLMMMIYHDKWSWELTWWHFLPLSSYFIPALMDSGASLNYRELSRCARTLMFDISSVWTVWSLHNKREGTWLEPNAVAIKCSMRGSFSTLSHNDCSLLPQFFCCRSLLFIIAVDKNQLFACLQ